MGELFLILLGGSIYFAPSIWAVGKRNTGAIFALNLLLGWTFLGWVGALIWAIMDKGVPKEVQKPLTVDFCPYCKAETRTWKEYREISPPLKRCADCTGIKD